MHSRRRYGVLNGPYVHVTLNETGQRSNDDLQTYLGSLYISFTLYVLAVVPVASRKCPIRHAESTHEITTSLTPLLFPHVASASSLKTRRSDVATRYGRDDSSM